MLVVKMRGLERSQSAVLFHFMALSRPKYLNRLLQDALDVIAINDYDQTPEATQPRPQHCSVLLHLAVSHRPTVAQSKSYIPSHVETLL
jgi:hypothetical protein